MMWKTVCARGVQLLATPSHVIQCCQDHSVPGLHPTALILAVSSKQWRHVHPDTVQVRVSVHR